MAEIAKEVFGFGKPGFSILILVMLAIASWLGKLISGAVGEGQMSMLIRTVTQISAILVVIKVAWELLTKFFEFTLGKM